MQTKKYTIFKNLFGGNVDLASTTTPLTGNATATSGWLPVSQFSRVTGTAHSDKAGTLRIHFSGDGSTTDYTREIAISADNDITGSAFDQLVVGAFIKFEYVNGATAQTSFRFYASGKGVS